MDKQKTKKQELWTIGEIIGETLKIHFCRKQCLFRAMII